MKPLIYLGGPIAGCTFAEMHERRNYLKNNPKNDLSDKFYFIDPTSRGLYANGVPANEIVQNDKFDIDRCDIVVIDAWKTSVGSAMEMMYAKMRGKTVFLVLPEGAVPASTNPWYLEHADGIFTGLEALSEALADWVPRALDRILDPIAYTIETDNGPVDIPVNMLRDFEEIQRLCNVVHNSYRQWWIDIATGEPKDRNYAETLILVISEVCESYEAHRKGGKKDDHLTQRPGREVEVMDTMIRLMDLIGGYNMDTHALVEKLVYNSVRADHKLEHRLGEGGKKC